MSSDSTPEAQESTAKEAALAPQPEAPQPEAPQPKAAQETPEPKSPKERDMEQTGLTAQMQQQEVEARLEELKEEFGEKLTELIVEVEFNQESADFLMSAEERLREADVSMSGKAFFYMHREPNGDWYVMRNLKPSEFSTEWLTLLDQQNYLKAFNKHADDLLRATMVYPRFEETDWEYEGGGKLNAPQPLTKSRLVGAFFDYELSTNPEQDNIRFRPGEIDTAVSVAKRKKKPSL